MISSSKFKEFSSFKFMTNWQCLTIDDVPNYMKDNDFIASGYRPKMKSTLLAISSIFRIHNETINIWTHLLGTIIYLCLLFNFQNHKPSSLSYLDHFMINSYCFINMITFTISAIFHTASCLEQNIYEFWNKLDYFGITLLISSSIISWVYYAFYRLDYTMAFYMISTSILGSLVSCLILSKSFNKPEKRLIRSIIFASFALLGFIPTFHYLKTDYYFVFSIIPMFFVGLFYILGVILYYLRIPERYFKSKFDYIGNSHQIFHCLVVIASLIHYYELIILANNRVNIIKKD